MHVETFVKRSRMPVSAEELFAWHARPGAFQRLVPPWESVRLVEHVGGIENGARVVIKNRLGPLNLKWVARHSGYQPGRQFCDEQLSGPFALWRHTHTMTPDGEGSVLEDRIEYALPAGRAGRLLAGRFVRDKIERMFAYRHAVTAQDLAAHSKHSGVGAMHVLISGSRGLIGGDLTPFLTAGGHKISRLSRSRTTGAPDTVLWDATTSDIDLAPLGEIDAVVHLAGESVAEGRWSAAKKARIMNSRKQGTRNLCEALARMPVKPKALVSASAVGYYGSRGDETLTEDSGSGNDFLAEVCQQWEVAAQPARDAGIRVVNLRFGVVMSPKGGVMAKMSLPFKMGGGGILGDGKQWVSWIALDDAVGAIHHALCRESLAGPTNAVAPNPVTNHDFTKALGKAWNRPTLIPMPAFAARLAFGEMADALLLASQRAVPNKLLSSGYQFRHPELNEALSAMLGV